MFPLLQSKNHNKSYTSFILNNDSDRAFINNLASIGMRTVIVRTRADSFPIYSDERYVYADVCGSQIITTDYPPSTVRQNEHTYSFDGYTVKLLNETTSIVKINNTP